MSFASKFVACDFSLRPPLKSSEPSNGFCHGAIPFDPHFLLTFSHSIGTIRDGYSHEQRNERPGFRDFTGPASRRLSMIRLSMFSRVVGLPMSVQASSQ